MLADFLTLVCEDIAPMMRGPVKLESVYACMCVCARVCACERTCVSVAFEWPHLLFQEAEGKIDEVAHSLKNSIKEKDRGAPSMSVYLHLNAPFKLIHPTQAFLFSLFLCVCSHLYCFGGESFQGQC